MKTLLCAVLGAAALLCAIPVSAAADSCPASQYVTDLSSASAALRQTPAGLEAAAATLRSDLASDSRLHEALDPIIKDLSSTPADPTDAQQRLDALLAVLSGPSAACNVDTSTAQHDLHDVYSAPAFRHLDDKPDTNPSWVETVRQWISDLLTRAGNTLGPWGTAALVTAVVVVIVALIIWRWRKSAPGRAARVRDTDEPAASDDPDVEWRAAEQAAARGDHREAIRRAFRSALLAIAVRGRMPVDAAWTTRELLQRSRADADLLTVLAPAAAAFDHAWYSGVAVTAEDWALARDRCAAIRRLAREAVHA